MERHIPAETNKQMYLTSLNTVSFFMEAIIYEEVSIVKDILGKIWYTTGMNSTNHAITTGESATCGTQAELMGRAIRLLGDMWTLMIVYTLLSGPKRFGELFEAIGKVSPKTVSQRLKLLEESGFVERQAFAEIPPRVEYSLTEKGQALVDIIEAIWHFAKHYLTESEPTLPPDSSCD